MVIISDSIKGPRKKSNEDKILVINEDYFKILFLFDGVGSAKNGKKSTSLASKFIEKNYPLYFINNNYLIKKLVFDTNNYLINQKKYEEAYTTYCSVCLYYNDNKLEFSFSNLGDSKIYIYNKQYLKQISTDDVLSPNSNVITKCLGLYNLQYKEIREIKLKNDKFNILMCSDGFSELLEEKKGEFFRIINSNQFNTIEKRLFNLIFKNNKDDCSYILIRQNV